MITKDPVSIHENENKDLPVMEKSDQQNDLLQVTPPRKVPQISIIDENESKLNGILRAFEEDF